MATAFVVWDRKEKTVIAPQPTGAFPTQAEADAVLLRMRRKDGADGYKFHNLERLQVNVD